MSAETPESVPTSADRRSHRPTKKRALTPNSAQAASLDALFARPDAPIAVGPPSGSGSAKYQPPEVVNNVQGSSAGAGSGEFHVYKAARRREYERLREMDAEVRRERDREGFEKEREERLRKDDERTRRNREKREKQRARKAKKGKPGAKVAARAAPTRRDDDEDGEEGREGEGMEGVQDAKAVEQPGLVIHDDD